MSKPVAISVQKIDKIYRIWKNSRTRWSGLMLKIVGDILPESVRLAWQQRAFRDFPALSGVSFEICEGEAVAIVGRNGSGKSTLLEIIAGTLMPSDGKVWTSGQVAALLELGSGFDPEFTGRENVYLNGAIFGLSREAVLEKLPEIEAFAEIGEFLDQPVKTYSSGMRMRLAFAVLTAVSPKILIVDEALSVGDVYFQSRCARWMEEFVHNGGTLLCVSHDTYLIQRLCSRGIVLHDGQVRHDGKINEAINLYYRLMQNVLAASSTDMPMESEGVGTVDEPEVKAELHPLVLRGDEKTGDGRIKLIGVWTDPPMDKAIMVGDWIRVRIEVEAHVDMEQFDVGFGFRDRAGMLLGGFHTFYHTTRGGKLLLGERQILEFEIQLLLEPQDYLLLVGAAINFSPSDWEDLDCYWDCSMLSLVGQQQFWGQCSLPVRHVSIKLKETAVSA